MATKKSTSSNDDLLEFLVSDEGIEIIAAKLTDRYPFLSNASAKLVAVEVCGEIIEYAEFAAA